MPSLTTDTRIAIEKVAFDTRLEKEASDWAPEIISAAYKSLPFLRSYEMDAELERVDSSRGYGVGKLLVYPLGMEKDAAIKSSSMVVFPIIVREKNLAPFDVFSHDGDFRPMTKEAVERALFQPGVFGTPAKKGDIQGTNMGAQITPPTSGRGLNKTGSVLEKAAHVIRDADRHAFIVKIGSHEGLRVVFERTPALRASLLTLGEGKEKTASDIRVQRRVNTPPDVIQIIEEGMGYLVKHASSKCFRPVVERRDVLQVQDLIGMEKMAELREQGSMVLTQNPTTSGSRLEKTAQAAETVGVYEALNGAQPILGIVVPRMLTFDGDQIPEGVFAGADSHAIQKVAGVHVRDITIPACSPRGRGVFVYQTGAQGIATEPVDITNHTVIEKVAYYIATRCNTGEQVKLMPTPGLRKIAEVRKGEYAIPSDMVFLPLHGKQIKVMEDAEVINRLESEKVAMDHNTVGLVSDGTSFSLRGPNAELAGYNQLMSSRETAFALGSLGVPGDAIPGVLVKAASSAIPLQIPGTRRVISEDLAVASMIKKAAAVVPNTDHLRHDLAREAALLCMPKAHQIYKTASVVLEKENLDAVLSLNFITPENVSVFIESLPDFEKTANKLAEIVVASRMGMDEVRESAACRAMKSLSDVIEGLVEIRDKIQ
jgi:hypothetical protein